MIVTPAGAAGLPQPEVTVTGVPGRGGPVPKRSDQRRRTNAPDQPIATAPASPARRARPPAASKDWHPAALRWYRSLAKSGQAVFYEASDWAAAWLVAEAISRELKPQFVGVSLETGQPIFSERPVKGASLAAWLQAMTGLLVTEGDRRRARVELMRAVPEPAGSETAVSRLDAYRRRVSG